MIIDCTTRCLQCQTAYGSAVEVHSKKDIAAETAFLKTMAEELVLRGCECGSHKFAPALIGHSPRPA
jgi:hypothetical protein